MWIFTVAPDWAVHLIFGLGVAGIIAGFVLGFIPFIKRYSLPIKIISLVVFALGVYLEGGLADNKEWEAKVKEVEAKVAKAEAEAAKANTQLQAAITERDNALNKKGETVIKYIDRFKDREVIKTLQGPERVRVEEVIKYVENCPVPKELLDIHNEAAKLNKAKGEKK